MRTTQELRVAVAAAVEAITASGSLLPWRESGRAAENFPADVRDPLQVRFAVDMPQTLTSASEGTQQRRGGGSMVQDTVRLQYLYPLRADDEADSYDEALQEEDRARQAVLGLPQYWHLVHAQTTRAATGEGEYLLGQLLFTARYMYNI